MTTEPDQFACSLDRDGATQRLAQVRALTDRLRRARRVDDRLLLAFAESTDTIDLVRQFVRDESQCCSFFSFDVRRRRDEVVLELSAPAGATHLLDAAKDSFVRGSSAEDLLTIYDEHADRGLVDPDV